MWGRHFQHVLTSVATPALTALADGSPTGTAPKDVAHEKARREIVAPGFGFGSVGPREVYGTGLPSSLNATLKSKVKESLPSFVFGPTPT